MTIESIVKYHLTGINQCEMNENVGFNLDKAVKHIEFQSPDGIYLEGINSKSGIDFITSIVQENKLIITEFTAVNIDDLLAKIDKTDFNNFKNQISCLIFVHNKEEITVLCRDKINI